jgi:uncharacterized protein (DUF433 family)
MSTEAILHDYPYLEKTDIQACLEYAASTARHEEIVLKRDTAA